MKLFKKVISFFGGGKPCESEYRDLMPGEGPSLVEPFEGDSISPEGAKFFVGIDFARDSDSTVIAKSRRGQIDWAMVRDGELPWVSQEPTWRCNRDTEVWEGGPFATISPGEPGEVLKTNGTEIEWSKLMEGDEPWYPFKENPEPGHRRVPGNEDQFTYCDGRYYLDKNTDLEIHPSEEDRGIEKLDSEPDHGNTWAGVGLYGKRAQNIHSDDTETDESRQYELTSGGSTVYAKTNASYPSGIDETTVLSLPEPNVRTPEQVDAEVQEILHRLGLGEETVMWCERPKNLLDKEDQAKAGDRLITVRKPIPRKKAWSPELRQALAGRKSKTFIAQELVWMLFGEIGAGGSIDFMKTVDMVNIVLASDLYRSICDAHHSRGEDFKISRNTIERALGRRK